MILEKLMVAEFAAESNIREEHNRLQAVKGIKKLLAQIDFSSEVVPTEDADKLTSLLVSLKGDRLNDDEAELVKEFTSI